MRVYRAALLLSFLLVLLVTPVVSHSEEESASSLDQQIQRYLCEISAIDTNIARSLACQIQSIKVGYAGNVALQASEQYLEEQFHEANSRVEAVKKMNGDPSRMQEIARVMGAMLLIQRSYMQSQSVTYDVVIPVARQKCPPNPNGDLLICE